MSSLILLLLIPNTSNIWVIKLYDWGNFVMSLTAKLWIYSRVEKEAWVLELLGDVSLSQKAKGTQKS